MRTHNNNKDKVTLRLYNQASTARNPKKNSGLGRDRKSDRLSSKENIRVHTSAADHDSLLRTFSLVKRTPEVNQPPFASHFLLADGAYRGSPA